MFEDRIRSFPRESCSGTMFFIHENANLSKVMSKYTLPDHVVTIIQKDSSNNRIGAFQYVGNKGRYDMLVVMPKFVSLIGHDKEFLETEFLKYLKTYQNILNASSKKAKQKISKENIWNLNFDKIQCLDSALRLRYIKALDSIIHFFKRHKSYLDMKEFYQSSALTEPLNIRANITEINKSKVHQIREYSINYSELANITFRCLKYFEKNIYPLLGGEPKIDKKIRETIFLLKKSLQRNFRLANKVFLPQDLIKPKVVKLFNKKSSLRLLHEELLILLAASQLDKGDIKLHNMSSLFFSPERMFELYVEQGLEEHFEQRALAQPKVRTSLYSGDKLLGTHTNKPDHIIELDSETVIVLDSKWKRVNGYNNVSEEDVLKLCRDKKALSLDASYCDKTILAGLIYPELPNNISQFNLLSFDYAPEDKFFVMSMPIFDSELIKAKLDKLYSITI